MTTELQAGNLFKKVCVSCYDIRYNIWSSIPDTMFGVPCEKYVSGFGGKFDYCSIDDRQMTQCYNYCRAFTSIIKQQKEDILYLEDDFQIIDYMFDSVMEKAICQIEHNNLEYDILYLCCDRRGGQTALIDKNILQIQRADGMVAAIIKKSAFETLGNIKPEVHVGIDGIISSRGFMKKLRCYSVYPNVITQKPVYSFNSRKIQHKTDWIYEPGNLKEKMEYSNES
jgi:hypothetical protein